MQADPEPGAGVGEPEHLLGEHGVEAEVTHPTPAVLLGDVHPEQPLPRGGGEQLPGRLARGAPGVDVREDLLVDERARHGAERLVVVVVQGAAHAGLPSGRRCTAA